MMKLFQLNRYLFNSFQLIKEKGYIRGYPGIGGRGTAPDYVGKFYNGSFPDNFKWGVAMSTYYPENTVANDGK